MSHIKDNEALDEYFFTLREGIEKFLSNEFDYMGFLDSKKYLPEVEAIMKDNKSGLDWEKEKEVKQYLL